METKLVGRWLSTICTMKPIYRTSESQSKWYIYVLSFHSPFSSCIWMTALWSILTLALSQFSKFMGFWAPQSWFNLNPLTAGGPQMQITNMPLYIYIYIYKLTIGSFWNNHSGPKTEFNVLDNIVMKITQCECTGSVSMSGLVEHT